jgi:hypothetical protein
MQQTEGETMGKSAYVGGKLMLLFLAKYESK